MTEENNIEKENYRLGYSDAIRDMLKEINSVFYSSKGYRYLWHEELIRLLKSLKKKK